MYGESAVKPNAFQIFCGYYLGLDSNFGAKFFNVHSLAFHYGIDSGELQALMTEYGMQPENMRHIDFNIARTHGIAQELTFAGTTEEVIAHARKSFEEFQVAAKKMDRNEVFEDLDYEDIFEDKKKEEEDNKFNR